VDDMADPPVGARRLHQHSVTNADRQEDRLIHE
jgi:hypothetical protein